MVYKSVVPSCILYYYFFYAEAGMFVIFQFLILSKNELLLAKMSIVSPRVPGLRLLGANV